MLRLLPFQTFDSVSPDLSLLSSQPSTLLDPHQILQNQRVDKQFLNLIMQVRLKTDFVENTLKNV